MNTRYILLLLLSATTILHAQQPDWRFGFEYIEIEPPFATEAQHDTLLTRLAEVSASQSVRGGINVNGLGGGWNGMQPRADAAMVEYVRGVLALPEDQRTGSSDAGMGPAREEIAASCVTAVKIPEGLTDALGVLGDVKSRGFWIHIIVLCGDVSGSRPLRRASSRSHSWHSERLSNPPAPRRCDP